MSEHESSHTAPEAPPATSFRSPRRFPNLCRNILPAIIRGSLDSAETSKGASSEKGVAVRRGPCTAQELLEHAHRVEGRRRLPSNPQPRSARPPTVPRAPQCLQQAATARASRRDGASNGELAAQSRAAAAAAEERNAVRLREFQEECTYLRTRFMFDRAKKTAERRIYARRITAQWRQSTARHAYRVDAARDAERAIQRARAVRSDVAEQGEQPIPMPSPPAGERCANVTAMDTDVPPPSGVRGCSAAAASNAPKRRPFVALSSTAPRGVSAQVSRDSARLGLHLRDPTLCALRPHAPGAHAPPAPPPPPAPLPLRQELRDGP